ncbi:MAG: hypothetical protein WAJ87_20275 [Bryobacteraceae bacterium]
MAGLSIGGNQTCYLTLGHLEKFAWVGLFSGTGNGLSTAPIDPKNFIGGVFSDGAAFNARVKLLWIGMGTGRCSIRLAASTSTPRRLARHMSG